MSLSLRAESPAPGPGIDDSPVVEIDELTKRFGSLTAVDALTFSVGRGQVVGLLGPNGAGKTTTLRMLLGLIKPTSGTVKLFGEQVEPGSAQLLKVGAMVEGPGFVPFISGRKNLELYWKSGGRPMAEADMDRALAAAALGPAIDAKYKTYSHGMRQRLALGQAMLSRPSLLVLDEPVNGLDPQQIAVVRSMLLHVAREGTTILLSSHLLWEVEQTCSHVVVMNQGRLVQWGAIDVVRGGRATAYLEVDDAARAAQVLAALPGVTGVRPQQPGIAVELAGAARRDLVAALVKAGIGVNTVAAGGGGLEQAYLDMMTPGAPGPAGLPGSGPASVPSGSGAAPYLGRPGSGSAQPPQWGPATPAGASPERPPEAPR